MFIDQMKRGFSKRGLSAVLCLWAGTGQAQWIAEDVDVETASGRIEIVDSGDGFSRVLQIGDARFFTDGPYRFVSVEAQRGALYLIALSSGGSACAAEYVWLHTEGAAPRITESFGTCAVATEVTSDAETVSVIMQSFDAADGFVAFVYDGKVIREDPAGQRSAGVGTQALDWVGRYPFDAFADADWRAALVELMGEDAYRRAGNTIEVSSPMVREGDWVIGRGCRSRMCDLAWGAIALHVDGRVVIAIRTDEAGLEVFGEMQGTPPSFILEVIEGR